jgi:hypothetical protein
MFEVRAEVNLWWPGPRNCLSHKRVADYGCQVSMGGVMSEGENQDYSIFLSNDQRLDILLEEYKLHKQEAALHLGILQRQSTYVQFAGVVLLSLAVVIFGTPDNFKLSDIPKEIRLFAIVGAAALLFFQASVVITASYSLLILRQRMSEVENRIIELAENDLLRHERDFSRTFHQRVVLPDGTLTPYSWSGIFRAALYLFALTTIFLLGSEVIPPGHSTLYLTVIIYFAVMQVRTYLMFYSNCGEAPISSALLNHSGSRRHPEFFPFKALC